jgi:hypothetical protein
MTITWSLAFGCGQTQNRWQQKIHIKCWPFQWPCGYGGAMQYALPNGAHPWLHAKLLDASIWQVPAPYCPSGRHAQRIQKKTVTKHNFYLAFAR